jgi:hypothetical protein
MTIAHFKLGSFEFAVNYQWYKYLGCLLVNVVFIYKDRCYVLVRRLWL